MLFNTPPSPFSPLYLITVNLTLVRCQLAAGQHTWLHTPPLPWWQTHSYFQDLCLEKQWQNVPAYFSCGGRAATMQHESKQLLQTWATVFLLFLNTQPYFPTVQDFFFYWLESVNLTVSFLASKFQRWCNPQALSLTLPHWQCKVMCYKNVVHVSHICVFYESVRADKSDIQLV